jgi:hypothetical protein
MKNLAAAIALFCLSNSVLAHDIYTDLHDRDGNLCCGRQDCTPVEVTVLPNGSYFLPRTGEIIPADMAMPSPDNRFHHCFYYPTGYEWERPKTRCFFAPNDPHHAYPNGDQQCTIDARDDLSHQSPPVLTSSDTTQEMGRK